MITEKGDPTNPKNYRPICSLRRLHKLFSTMQYNRLHALDRYQCPDQAAFRKAFQRTDHMNDVQTHLPEKQRVEDGHVGGSDRLQEGMRFFTTCSNLEISQKSFGQ